MVILLESNLHSYLITSHRTQGKRSESLMAKLIFDLIPITSTAAVSDDSHFTTVSLLTYENTFV